MEDFDFPRKFIFAVHKLRITRYPFVSKVRVAFLVYTLLHKVKQCYLHVHYATE